MSWDIWEEDYKLNEEKGVAIENYNPSKTPFIHALKELGLEGHNFGKHTFFSFKELFSFYPKIPEILLALEEHRTRLRKKIDEEFKNKLIHTIRGGGYVIKDKNEKSNNKI